MERLAAVSCIWAFSFGINKQWVAGADPVLVSFIRLALALLVALPWLRRPRAGLAAVPELMGIGAVQFGLMYVALNYCFVVLQAYQVALFTVFTPLYVAGFCSVRRGRAPLRLFAAALAALAGAALVEGWAAERRAFWAAFAVMQISNLAFAWGQVAYRDWRRRHPGESDLSLFGWLYLGGTLVTLAWAAFGSDWGETAGYPPSRWAALLYLGLAASGAGFYLWNTGALRAGPGALSAMNNLKSPLAVLVSAVFWGAWAGMSPLDWARLAAGSALILAAAVFSRREAED
ncbi:MAG: EamA family transporter [Elusimicrobiales bacterium]|jgi:drug/metabolite transporter (DMT)-like permease|nr:EamA family transporter [Elusimicrobiales bacterium]